MIAFAPQSASFPVLSDAEILSDEMVADFPVAFFCPNGHDFVVTFTDEAEAEMYAVAECKTCTAYAKTTPFSDIPRLFTEPGADALTLAQSRRTPEQQAAAVEGALIFAQFATASPEREMPLAS